jgi:UDP-sulfoquinovose synthase
VRIIVLGGDGYLGWPTALHLAERGHHVAIADNFVRRQYDHELGVRSLVPIEPLAVRVRAWRELTGQQLGVFVGDLCDADFTYRMIREYRPDAVVHFAEQRAAPYSMKSSKHKRYTVDNNVNATHNLLAAIVEAGLDTHVVHLGTMGVYGYGKGGVKIPEGYQRVKMLGDDGTEVEQEILYPTDPGSVYHMTKAQDQLLFAFYVKNDEVRVTDLHQGIVWGTQTPETSLDERLVNRFDYDGDYGTVLNRFLMQASIGYPLTVHGTGGQTRAFIHIRDTVRCVRLAIEHAPERGERVRIFNQMTEVHRVIDLAELVAGMTGAEIDLVGNPRKEASHNDLLVENRSLIDLGLDPIRLEDELLREVTEVAERWKDRCDREKIPCRSLWVRKREPEPASNGGGEAHALEGRPAVLRSPARG